ncbi:MAG: hypothetical protein JW936_10185 [Sedimentisphaerales bacterium]|nr:hypothetical protein [Sedimentisphaerales bacterium]
MKKLCVSLIVLMMATVASAVNTVDISLVDEGSGVLAVEYSVNQDPCAPSVPVAYSLTIALSDGATVEPCDVIETDPCYPVFIDFAHDAVGSDFDPADWDPCDPCYEIGDGHPMANPNAAGAPTDPCDTFSLCMGRLDENQVAGPLTGTLVRIQLADGGAGYTNVTVAADGLRGGVVGSTFTVIPVYEDGAATRVDFNTACFVEGMTDSSGHVITAADVAQWNAWGQPACWCYTCFGSGDGNGDCVNTTGDLFLVIDAGGAGFLSNACGDFNYDGVCTTGDLFKVIDPGGAGFLTCPLAGSCVPVP